MAGNDQPLARPQFRGDRHPRQVRLALGLRRSPARPVDHVVHARRHPEVTGPRSVHQQRAQASMAVVLAGQGRRHDRGHARVTAIAGQRLVGHQLRLHYDPRRVAERLDLVQDRRHGPLHEGNQARRAHPYTLAGGRDPLHLAPQHPVAQVEHPLVARQLAVAGVEGLVVDQKPDQLAVGDVDQCLPVLRVAVAGLRVGERTRLVEPVEVRAGHARGLALVEVAAQADVPVGERKHGLGHPEQLRVQPALGHGPRLDGEDLVADHDLIGSRAQGGSTESCVDITVLCPLHGAETRQRPFP
jgi:hypothetical protein